MKKLKLLLALVLGLAFFTAFAQQKTNVKFGIRAGVGLPTFAISGPGRAAYLEGNMVEYGNGAQEIKAKLDFFVGAFTEIPLSSKFTFQPGLTFVNKGVRIQEPFNVSGPTNAGTYVGEGYYYREEVRLSYLEVPLNVVMNIPLKNGSVFFGGGPYVGMALLGKEKIEADYTLTVSAPGSGYPDAVYEEKYDGTRNIEWKEDGYKRTDFGVNLLAGYQLKKGVNFNLGYGLGLSNVCDLKDEQVTMKNRIFTIGVGCKF